MTEATAKDAVEIESALRPTARSLVREAENSPGLPPAWLAARDEQLRLTRVINRTKFWAPAALALIVGIALGVSPLTMTIKCWIGAVAGTIFGLLVSSYLVQSKRTDAAYQRMPKR